MSTKCVWIKTSRGETLITLRDGETVEEYHAREASRNGPKGLISYKGVGHVSRALPKWTEGADGYTKTGEPIVENQATIDRIMKKNPSLNYGEDALAHE